MSCEEYLANFTELIAAMNKTPNKPGQYEYEFIKEYVYGVGLPLICAFGILGNILNLVVLTRKQLQKSMDRMEKSAHLGLVALAVSDMLFCVVAFPVPFIPNKFLYTQLDSLSLIYFEIYNQSLLNIFLFCSTWLTVTMATARYLAICHPLHSRGFINLRGTRIAICCVFLVSVFINLPQFWHYVLITKQCTPECVCYSKASGELFKNTHFDYAYKVVWAVFGVFLPVAVLTFCNFCLIRALRQSLKMQRMYRANAPKDSGHRITPTLITIVVLFTILVIPSEILKFLKDVVIKQGKNSNYHIYQSATVITNFMQAINFAINFVLYCVINVHFRETIKYVILCKWYKKTAYSKAHQARGTSLHHTTMTTYITDVETEM